MRRKIVLLLVFSVLLAGCEAKGGKNDNAERESEAAGAESAGNEAETAAVTDSRPEEIPPETDSLPGEGQIIYPVYLEAGDEYARGTLLGAERIERKGSDVLRIYYERTNLSDILRSTDFYLSPKQDGDTLFPWSWPYDDFAEKAETEGWTTAEEKLAGYEHSLSYYLLMPQVTQWGVRDFELQSDSDVEVQIICGSADEGSEKTLTLDLQNLPGAPESLPTVSAVTDPEKWKEAVAEYTDRGTINLSDNDNIEVKIDAIEMIDDPEGEGYESKLLKMTLTCTNNGENELSNPLARLESCVYLFQDGIALDSVWREGMDIALIYSDVIASGESGEISFVFPAVSDSPAFAVIHDPSSSLRDPRYFGQVFTVK